MDYSCYVSISPVLSNLSGDGEASDSVILQMSSLTPSIGSIIIFLNF